jgi:hypothetical protein
VRANGWVHEDSQDSEGTGGHKYWEVGFGGAKDGCRSREGKGRCPEGPASVNVVNARLLHVVHDVCVCVVTWEMPPGVGVNLACLCVMP